MDRWAQCCRAVGPRWTTTGIQGRCTYGPRNAMASSPGSWARGTSRAQPSCTDAVAPQKGRCMACDQPGQGSLSETQLALGAGTEVSPSHLPRSLEPSFRVGQGPVFCLSQGPGLCRPERPPTHTNSTTPRRWPASRAGGPWSGCKPVRTVWVSPSGRPPPSALVVAPSVPLIPATRVLRALGWGMGTWVLPGALQMAGDGCGQQPCPGDVSQSRTSQPHSLLAAYQENSGLTIQL